MLSICAAKLLFDESGTFRILHLSDVHYRPGYPCRDVSGGTNMCTETNTTDFIARLIETANPNLVVHTGDVIDGNSHSAADAMDTLYGVSMTAGVKWTATLGNHDDDSDMNRPEVMEYIVQLDKDSDNNLSQMNSLDRSYGNYYLELFAHEADIQPVWRTFHIDSSTNNVSVNAAQTEWLRDTLQNIHQTPALLFTHIPTKEYYSVLKDGVCGSIGESPSVAPEGASELVPAILEEGSIKALFVGHDHTNDYCGLYANRLQLCYEGSPGYQGYGHCWPHNEKCYERRARVTEIQDYGGTVVSYKLVDDWPTTRAIDHQVLWGGKVDTCPKTVVSESEISLLKPLQT